MTLAIPIREPARPDSKLEWWFLHGRFSSATDERHFMASLFRVELPCRAGRGGDGFSVLLSVLDRRTGEQRTSSRVDRRIAAAVRHPDAGRELDPFWAAPVLEELRDYGLPREFECPEAEPVLEVEPFRFQWADLRAALCPGGFRWAFDEPGTGRPLCLELTAMAPGLAIEAAGTVGEPEEAMQYVTLPELRLTGTAGGEAIQGEAWFDHQWGGRAWLRSGERPPRVRGWDWLGFRLDDGSAGVAMAHWDAASRAEFARHLTVRDAEGTIRQTPAFEWSPVRWWISPATRIEHPVAWRLRVPEWDADLLFEPLSDHQEIRVFGSLRAIWEGAGRVRGRWAGREVQGSARLEGQGRGYQFEAADFLKSWAGLVDRELGRFLPRVIEETDVRRYAGPPAWTYEPDSYTRMLSEPLWDLMERDGKRWRAIFSFLLLDALGRDPEPLLDVELVLPELLHNASLIIDDIQDASPLRRGRPAIHHSYGVDVAISAANTAYFLPLLVVLDHPVLTREEKQGISEAYQRQLVRAHLGQSLDLFWTRTLSPDRLATWMADSIGPKILQAYALKTAALVEGMAEAAALLAGAGQDVRRAVLAFARSLGMAFQLIDDVKNFTCAPGWGKQRGEDLRNGKLTYVILRALEKLPEKGRRELREILCRPQLRESAEGLDRGIDLVLDSGACESVRQEARAQIAPSWEALSRLVPPSSSKIELRLLWEVLVGRECDR
jgi:geranylgeranyl pyrophosphate synthase/predicted secreted hydrolase